MEEAHAACDCDVAIGTAGAVTKRAMHRIQERSLPERDEFLDSNG